MSEQAMNKVAGPNAERDQQRRITKWHAQGHDELDRYGIPRFVRRGSEVNYQLTIAERIVGLADEGNVPHKPRRGPNVVGPVSEVEAGP